MSRLIYIASPYTGDEDANTVLQIKMADEIRQLGLLPYWPLCTHYWHLQIPHDYEYWMKMDFEWIKRCDALLRVGGNSQGANREVEFAIEHNIPVVYSLEELKILFAPLIRYLEWKK